MDSMQADALRRVREMHSPTSPRGERTAGAVQGGVGRNTSSLPQSPAATTPSQREPNMPTSPRGERTAETVQGGVGRNASSLPQSPAATTPSVSHSLDSSLTEGTIFADKEKFLILALIMILSSEEQSDPMLTLALLYLII